MRTSRCSLPSLILNLRGLAPIQSSVTYFRHHRVQPSISVITARATVNSYFRFWTHIPPCRPVPHTAHDNNSMRDRRTSVRTGVSLLFVPLCQQHRETKGGLSSFACSTHAEDDSDACGGFIFSCFLVACRPMYPVDTDRFQQCREVLPHRSRLHISTYHKGHPREVFGTKAALVATNALAARVVRERRVPHRYFFFAAAADSRPDVQSLCTKSTPIAFS